jgi:hypothetical protein
MSLSAKVEYFESPKSATKAFVDAVEADNQAKLKSLFTSDYAQLISSNKITEEEQEFLEAYYTSHHLVSFDGSSVYIEVGKSNWTFPIPLAKGDKGWFFDVETGMENIKTRYIGKNELNAIYALEHYSDLKTLEKSDASFAYSFSMDKEGNIIATPKEYDKSAIMSFALSKDGVIYEADTKGEEKPLDSSFKKVPSEFLH